MSSEEKPDALTSTTYSYLRTLDDYLRFMVLKNFILLLLNPNVRRRTKLKEEDVKKLWEMKEEADELWTQANSDIPSAWDFEIRAKKKSDEIAEIIFPALPEEILNRAAQKTETREPTVLKREKNG